VFRVKPRHQGSGGGRQRDGSAKGQEEEIQNRTSPPGEVVYGAVYLEGEHELERDSRSLAWSGLAAGLSMGFSFVAEGLIRSYLPDAKWVPLAAKFGYAIGFLIVILGRQQLFTKNTLTVILPLLNRKGKAKIADVARLWIIVLVSNIVGACIFAWLLADTSVFDENVRNAFSTIGRQAFELSFVSTFFRSVLSGWLIALMIWLLPFAETARVGVIILLAYLVGVGHLPHIVAGSIPGFYYVFTGGVPWTDYVVRFFIPVLLGNVVGGVALVAAGAHAEFHIEHESHH
jgi:formate/nitrite transporter FocA (FNT family)